MAGDHVREWGDLAADVANSLLACHPVWLVSNPVQIV